MGNLIEKIKQITKREMRTTKWLDQSQTGRVLWTCKGTQHLVKTTTHGRQIICCKTTLIEGNPIWMRPKIEIWDSLHANL